MAKQLSEETKVTIDLKTIGMAAAGIFALATMWFTLQNDIALAKELPAPVIDRVEYDLKDELIRQTIMDTCLLYTSPSPRDAHESRMPSSA